MKQQLLKEIIEKKEKRIEFAIITNLDNGESCIFEKHDGGWERTHHYISTVMLWKRDRALSAPGSTNRSFDEWYIELMQQEISQWRSVRSLSVVHS